MILAGCEEQSGEIVINSNYQIIIPQNAQQGEREAAEILRQFLNSAVGGKLVILSDSEPSAAEEILIGNTNRWKNAYGTYGKDIDREGFRLIVDSKKVFLGAISAQGHENAVYELLEKLGARRFVSSTTIIPVAGSAVLSSTDYTFNPPFSFRHVQAHHADDNFFTDWHKLHGSDEMQNWGLLTHTFDKLIPAKRYFKTNPEWFSQVNNIRIPDGQLCLTNKAMKNELIKNLAAFMAMKPQALYWSVSQNSNYHFCQCRQCKILDDQEESHAGSLIHFINQVADAFPEKGISTLAHHYSRKPPAQIKPHNNVHIMLSTAGINRSQPIATDPTSASFRSDLSGWKDLTENLMVWDYVTQFTNYVSPFPNLRVLQPNIQYMRDAGVTMMFQQGNRHFGGEFNDLRAYLIAKLLWNPDILVDSTISEFCNNYYGTAGPSIKAYIDLMHSHLAESGAELSIYGSPANHVATFLKPEYMDQYNHYFNEAELAVENDPEIRDRVKLARLSLAYATQELAKVHATNKKGFYMFLNNKWMVIPGMRTFAQNFNSEANRLGIQMLNEQGMSPKDYWLDINAFLKTELYEHLAFKKGTITADPIPEKKYAGGALIALHDGITGSDDILYSWLGWEGKDFQVTLDLGAPQKVNKVTTHFLQNPDARVWIPEEIAFEVSGDGQNFQPLRTFKHPGDRKSMVLPFSQSINMPVQYIRINVDSRETCPDWHYNAGEPAWALLDEIIVE